MSEPVAFSFSDVLPKANEPKSDDIGDKPVNEQLIPWREI